MKIVSIGEATVDHYLRQNLAFVGGISLNFAVHAKRCGAEVSSLVSCVGDGREGKWVLDTLAQEQVDSSCVAVCDGETAVCAVEVLDNADRIFPKGGYQLNVLEHLQLTDANCKFIQQHDIWVTMCDSNMPDSLIEGLIQVPDNDNNEMKRVVDFGDWSNGRKRQFPYDILNNIDLAFFSSDTETLDSLIQLAQSVSCLIVVTLGGDGSVALLSPKLVSQPAIQVANLIDTTGCGDAFQAAFTISYFRDGDVATALNKGAIHAANVLGHYGAFSQQAKQLE